MDKGLIPRFELYKRQGQWYWEFRDENYRLLAWSPRYQSKEDCKRAVKHLRDIISDAEIRDESANEST